MSEQSLRLYADLADWWPLLSPPQEYAEEAALYLSVLKERVRGPLTTLLELGSGGGSNAHHFDRDIALTLVDPSPGMLAVSRALNPHARHVLGDMRDVDLGETFDAVFIQDAIDYMVTEAELQAAIATAVRHLRPGGAVLLAPDHTTEVFGPSTSHGGHDGDGRGLRYLFWETDPDPHDQQTTALMTYVLREDGEAARTITEEHTYGLFPRATWIAAMEAAAGLTAIERLPFTHSDFDEGEALDMFVGVRR